MNGIPMLVLCSLMMPVAISQAAQSKPGGPTAETALAADEELAHAIRDNDPDAILRLVDSGWAVVATSGAVGEGPSIFPDGIRSGSLTRKTFEISEPRVRLYGNVAVVTTKVVTSGTLGGKPIDVTERQTDVLVWKSGRWKCALTHETKIQNN
jgi:ketosteroid isomerase-like protein